MFGQLADISDIHFIAVAVTFADFAGAIDFRHAAAGLEDRGIGAEPHGAAEIAAFAAGLELVALASIPSSAR